MVLIYPGTLPEGALVRTGTAAPPPEPLWLDAGSGLTLSDAGRVLAWSAKSGRATARPVPGNVNGTGFLTDPPALHFMAGENGGLRLSDALPDAAMLTFGVILTPDLPEARTLLSLQPLGHLETDDPDYIFISLEGMALRLARKGSDTALALTLSPDTRVPLMILCGLNGGLARLSVNGGPVQDGKLPVVAGPADLFIGCRSGRKGMRTKLGGIDLTDVTVWPGRDLLAEAALPDRATAPWDDRCHRGL